MSQALPLPSAHLRQTVQSYLPWSCDADWSALFGGRTNSAWQVANGTHSAVVKLYRSASGNPLFPNDPKAEAAMLRHLNGQLIAPNLIAEFQTRDGAALIYETIPGQIWRENTGDVALLMRHLHALPKQSGLRETPNGSGEIQAQTDQILALCQGGDTLKGLRSRQTIAPTDTLVLLHCDIVPGNLIVNDTGLHLIDWQCPAIGDACEDIAIFLSPAMQTLYRGTGLTASETETLFNLYPEPASRYQALAPFYHQRMAAYCLWKTENGSPEYSEGLQAETAALSACL